MQRPCLHNLFTMLGASSKLVFSLFTVYRSYQLYYKLEHHEAPLGLWRALLQTLPGLLQTWAYFNVTARNNSTDFLMFDVGPLEACSSVLEKNHEFHNIYARLKSTLVLPSNSFYSWKVEPHLWCCSVACIPPSSFLSSWLSRTLPSIFF